VDGVAKSNPSDYDITDSGGTSWSLGEAPYLKFAVAPGSGKPIVATYWAMVPVRFDRDDLMEQASVLSQKATSALTTVALPEVRLVQDFPGSHLVTVPTP
jgi:hypothetical protein